MDPAIFTGKLVRLDVPEPESFSKLIVEWGRNSEYSRLQDSDPARRWTPKQVREWLEKNLGNITMFAIRTLADDRIIGEVDLEAYSLPVGNAWVGIGIGEKEYWGKGYGTDAMRIAIRYGFRELNLRRISLTVFEYNPRGIRSYEKAGFREEGREREWLSREGRRWDMVYMGILRKDWEAQQGE